jgi:hypothetical protein
MDNVDYPSNARKMLGDSRISTGPPRIDFTPGHKAVVSEVRYPDRKTETLASPAAANKAYGC